MAKIALRGSLSQRTAILHASRRLEGYDLTHDSLIQNSIPPVAIALCPTAKCTRKCKFCSNTARNSFNRKLNPEYPEHVFDQIVDDICSLSPLGVTLVGGGEPLCYDKPPLTRLLSLDQPPFTIRIVTNGVLLDRLLNPSLISKGNIALIVISIVAHTADLYHKVTCAGRTQFQHLERNLRNACKLGLNNNGGPHIVAKVMVNRDNYRFTHKIVNYLEAMGLSEIIIRCVGNFETHQDVELNEPQINHLRRLLAQKLHLTHEETESIIRGQPASIPVPSRCWIAALQFTAGIDPDGEVYLCAPWSQKEYSIGNVKQDRLSNIWGGARHRHLANTLNEKLQSGQCNPLLCRHYFTNLHMDDYFLKGHSHEQGTMEGIVGRFL